MSFAITGAVVVAAGTAYSAYNSYEASKNAANQQSQAANNANSTQWAMYNQNRQDQTPWRTAGGQAVNALSNWYGLGGVAGAGGPTTTGIGQPTGPGGGSGGLNGIYGPGTTIPGGSAGSGPSAMSQEQTIRNTPGYQFNFDQGSQAVQRNLASKGLLNSGAAGKALTQYGQGYADNYQQQYVGGLQSLAGLGQSSVQATGNLGANAANQIGSNDIYSGNAQAYGTIGQANAINKGIGSLIQQAGGWFGGGRTSSYWGGAE
jgi:hypothetical protein